jgi:TPP-dependent pyruvate/acetoin dehydrogenase alpha subunit
MAIASVDISKVQYGLRIVGAQVPVGVGLAFAQKYLGKPNATFVANTLTCVPCSVGEGLRVGERGGE